MFRWRERESGEGFGYGVDWAVTDRHGGASQGSYAELNLGASVGDLEEAVNTNRHRLAHSFRVPASGLRFMRQQHGSMVAEVGPEEPLAPEADALITGSTEVALVVLVADCTPVLLLDRSAGLAAAVHAGRKGMAGQVVPATVQRLRELGAEDLEAVIGPSVCSRCYEVPGELRAEVSAAAPSARAVSATGTPALDVAAGVAEQLHQDGVPLRWLPGCTRESEDLYSHRRDGTTGRFAGVIRLLPPEGAA